MLSKPVVKSSKISLIILTPLLLLAVSLLFYPDWLFSVLACQSPQVLYFVETQQPVVALTIDDGPDAATTPQTLDLLKQYNSHDTFFLIANRIPGNEAIVRRTVAEGHEIGNHMVEDFPSIDLLPAEFERRLLQADNTLSQFARPRWFRPGSGWYNQTMLAIVGKHHYKPALGSVYPLDPQIPSSWFAAHYILWNVEPGSVIILHDFGPKGRRTIETLTVILPELKRRGYNVVTLSELESVAEKENNSRGNCSGDWHGCLEY